MGHAISPPVEPMLAKLADGLPEGDGWLFEPKWDGFRWHKNGRGTMVGSLLLGLHDDAGKLHHVGICSSFTTARRRELVAELEPLREGAMDGHPWRDWAEWADA